MIKASILIMVMTTISACPDEPFCAQCATLKDGSKQCARCDFAFLDPSSHTCSQVVHDTVANCVEYGYNQNLGRWVCIRCEEGFRATNDNFCFRCPTYGCAICDSNSGCTACFNNMVLDNNVCYPEKKCSIQNCEWCGGVEEKPICYKCMKGFALNDNHSCDLTLLNCLQLLNNDPNACQICARGFYLTSDNGCQQNPDDDGHSKIWFWFSLIMIAIFGGAFYYYRVYRQGPQRNVYREDYVSVN